MATESQSLVSCICITRKRPEHLLNAIGMFKQQTYLRKELILICDDNDHESINIARNNNIIPVVLDHTSGLSLGQIRSIGIGSSNGDFICQWDDDDWYHKDRILYQMNFMHDFGQNACALTNWLIYDETSKKSYLSMHRIWEGSIIYKRAIAEKLHYPNSKLGEDTIFTNALIKECGLLPIVCPYLYIYRIHNENSWGAHRNHFKMMLSQAQQLPEEISEIIHTHINSPSRYDFFCDLIKQREFLANFHFFKFNNLNYTNSELIDYMGKIDQFDEAHFLSMTGNEIHY
jgi:glycosyltransferase involved in cell wall biosynthesis